MLWFTADLHYGHENVIKYSNRPFENLEQMHDTLITNHNEKVGDDDDVYIIGDVVWKCKYLPLLDLLKGNLHLIAGNHDHQKTKQYPRFSSVQDILMITYQNYYIVLSHFPFEAWDRQHYGSIHLHGHTHGGTSHQISTIKNRYDVGVDANNMYPISIDSIIQKYNHDNM